MSGLLARLLLFLFIAGLFGGAAGSRSLGRSLGGHAAQGGLGIRVSVLGGKLIPAAGFGQVAGNARTLFVHEAKAVLGGSFVLLRSLAVPVHSLSIILRCAAPLLIHIAALVSL